MTTRVSITFDHPQTMEEATVRRNEDELMAWAKGRGYVSPMITGSLFFKESTFSWLWGDEDPKLNFAKIINAQLRIAELFH